MAITVDWPSKVISVPKADMLLIHSVPVEVRELNLDTFRRALKSLEDGEEGMIFPDTHRHNTEVSLAGITLASVVEIINGYTVTFEDGQYAVNAVGANSNLADVLNLNQVSLRSFNSAGLIVVSSGSGLSEEEHEKLMGVSDEASLEAVGQNVLDVLSVTEFIKEVEGGKWVIVGNQMIFYKSDNATEIMRFDITRDSNQNPIARARV